MGSRLTPAVVAGLAALACSLASLDARAQATARADGKCAFDDPKHRPLAWEKRSDDPDCIKQPSAEPLRGLLQISATAAGADIGHDLNGLDTRRAQFLGVDLRARLPMTARWTAFIDIGVGHGSEHSVQEGTGLGPSGFSGGFRVTVRRSWQWVRLTGGVYASPTLPRIVADSWMLRPAGSFRLGWSWLFFHAGLVDGGLTGSILHQVTSVGAGYRKAIGDWRLEALATGEHGFRTKAGVVTIRLGGDRWTAILGVRLYALSDGSVPFQEWGGYGLTVGIGRPLEW